MFNVYGYHGKVGVKQQPIIVLPQSSPIHKICGGEKQWIQLACLGGISQSEFKGNLLMVSVQDRICPERCAYSPFNAPTVWIKRFSYAGFRKVYIILFDFSKRLSSSFNYVLKFM